MTDSKRSRGRPRLYQEAMIRFNFWLTPGQKEKLLRVSGGDGASWLRNAIAGAWERKQ